MMEIFTIIVLCAAMFGIGVLFGSETRVDKPKTRKTKNINEASDGELIMLFMAVGSELDKRGIMDTNPFLDGRGNDPFDELKK